jgi:transposase-like protein
MSKKQTTDHKQSFTMPSAEAVQRELATATSIDDFFGGDGIIARLFAQTLEEMMAAELTESLGYERYEAKGRNSGNSRNGSYSKRVKTSNGEIEVQVPRDRNSEYQPTILRKYETSSSELEDKIVGLYGRGMTTRDIQLQLADLYGMDVSAQLISDITDKVMPLVEAWQNRPLQSLYPIIYLDALVFSLRREHRVEKVPVYIVLAIDLTGHKEVLGHWVGTGSEGASFWLSVLTDIHNRGVEDVFIASVDGLTGFADAIHSVFPGADVQRCIVHQIRTSMKYVSYQDRKAFARDLKTIYQAPTRAAAETALLELADKWQDQYAIAVRSWENNWEDLATMFKYTAEIRRLIYTTNPIEGYNRQLRKTTKNRGVFPTPEALLKLLWLTQRDAARKWTMPIPRWPSILNQLAIHFEDRFQI